MSEIFYSMVCGLAFAFGMIAGVAACVVSMRTRTEKSEAKLHEFWDKSVKLHERQIQLMADLVENAGVIADKLGRKL